VERNDAATTPTRRTYAGVFMVALATLMYEILLTRIFSVTMWYHFAFVAISIAMLGMTVGALAVFLRPKVFTPERTKRLVARFAVGFPWALALSFLTQCSIPFRVHPSIVALYAIIFTYAVIAVPFAISGVVVCLALTRFRRNVSLVYAADLAGAALGCVLLVFVLDVTDAATAVFVVAAFAALGGLFLAFDSGSRTLMRLALTTFLLFGAFSAVHTVFVWKQFPVLRILYIKGQLEARPLYEKWNSYSRVRVNGKADEPEVPYTWGLSSVYPADRTVKQLHMDIDVSAGTVLTRFDGSFDPLEHLKYDVTNVGYHVRPGASVLVVGTGGGRDILSALAFGARSVTGVELNRQIIATVNERFGDFTGHLDRDPRVRFVNDEARSYIARERRPYDFIQISLIDTWAATAAGAFVLSENTLYTTDSWRVFLRHLTDRGILSVSRWYAAKQPAEAYRLVALAATSLQEIGVTRPRDHIVLIANLAVQRRRGAPTDAGPSDTGVGTILVSRQPFTQADLAGLEAVSRDQRFQVVLSPRSAADQTFARVASGDDLASFTSSFPLNIAAPTDDSPFFFHVLRLRDMFRWSSLPAGVRSQNTEAVFVLGALLAAVLLLTVLCIFVPLRVVSRSIPVQGNGWLLTFFAAIGLGFMLVETSQMQRLIVVLGHPTYALSVVLFSLLLSSGVGSYLTDSVVPSRMARSGVARLGALLVLLVVFGLCTPLLVRSFEGAETPVRVAVAVAVLMPLGLFMGMAFPLGMKVADGRAPELTPWLWGVNGATSVLASVMTVAIAMTWTISTSFWTGFASYAVAAAAFWKASAQAAEMRPSEAARTS
jgi:predicted membrane-bound spermidine synthase